MHHKTVLLAAAALGLALATGAARADHKAANSVSQAAAAAAGVTPSAAPTLPPEGEGRRLYLKLNCYGCHGMGGTGGMGPNIVRAEFGDVSEALRQGEDQGMRSFSSFVTTTDINNIAAYLRSIGTATEPKFRDWWVAVPTK